MILNQNNKKNRYLLFNFAVYKKTMSKSITSFFLISLLLLPNLVQSFHVFGEHSEEYFCTEKSIHLHEEENECILEYTFTNPFVDTHKKIDFQVKYEKTLKNITYKDQFLLDKLITGKKLRAPPYPLFSLDNQPL